jgi:hypothetical protein
VECILCLRVIGCRTQQLSQQVLCTSTLATQVNENSTLDDLLNQYFTPRPENTHILHQLQRFVECRDQLKLFLPVIPLPVERSPRFLKKKKTTKNNKKLKKQQKNFLPQANQAAYYKLTPSSTLLAALSGRTIMEFPIFIVATPADFPKYPLLTAKTSEPGPEFEPDSQSDSELE